MQRTKIIGALLLGLFPAAADGATFTVSTTAASGIGSMEAVIIAANATPGTDTIEFAIAGTGVKTLVAPAAGYRQITESLIINGYTQSGAAVNTIANDASNAVLRIEIDASAVTTSFGRVFAVDGGNVTLRGLALKNLANDVYGIRQGNSAGLLTVAGCFLGTDAAGSVDLSSGNALELRAIAVIGGAAVADRNLISGNFFGIVVQPDSTGVTIRGNLIGTDASGSALIPNDRAIDIAGGVAAVHMVGGTGSIDGNRIVGSTLSGLRLFGNGRTAWLRNRVYDNAGLGIDIGGDGIDINDPGDGDTGPNGRENAPVMYSAIILGNALRVNGRLDGNFTSGTKRVEFFASVQADPTGYGEGDQYLSSINVFPGAGPGVVEFKTSITPASMPTLPFVIAAIATSADGASSEFSNVVSAIEGGVARTVTTVADSGAGSLRQALLDAAANPGADTVLFNIPNSGPHIIAPLSALPLLNGPTIIDGYSQPGALHNTAAVGFDGQIRIVIDGSSAGAVDGFTQTADRAQISGLAIANYAGAGIYAGGGDGPVLRGNLIGTDATGTIDVSAFGNGIELLSNGTNNTIGGSSPTTRNVISGVNTGITTAAGATTANSNVIQNNLIGTAVNGSSPLPNSVNGVVLESDNNTIANNTIAFNAQKGVVILAAGTGNRISANSIFSNGTTAAHIGIDLGDNGVTANDTGDGDLANGQQNYPVLTAASTSTIQGTLNSTANATITLEFFSNSVAEPSGFGEGRTYLGSLNVVTNGSGNATFSFTPLVGIFGGEHITATATNANGDTSEFSQSRPVLGPTSANVEIAGQVVSDNGRPVMRAYLTLTDQSGNVFQSMTNPFGYFRFSAVPSGVTYVLSVRDKSHEFTPSSIVLEISSDIDDLMLIGTRRADQAAPEPPTVKDLKPDARPDPNTFDKRRP